MPPAPEVRRMGRDDLAGWRALWDGYNAFYRNEVTESVTRVTFRRLCEGTDGFLGPDAADADGTLVGLAHAVFRPSTWTEGNYCYLEDPFVSGPGRGTGAARRLIEEVCKEADARDAGHVYWHAQAYNTPARSLYDQVVRATSSVVYER